MPRVAYIFNQRALKAMWYNLVPSMSWKNWIYVAHRIVWNEKLVIILISLLCYAVALLLILSVI
ncbi:hypothetical protein HYPSUDRAFT_586634 [Hypholoma sublateritium FD-334 SS-4]|uniref:Uncharacterized protein n=1 Tax=Hypholoma sublateritium (strain FD-334 SS-4) TaxID=945553 RepID=A0A0D2L877_HYPSF|nr:hypothetical protein HYPSUDRAFT_586634 [Hypholoma sublateritium FD-334 SS-4]